MRRSIPLLVLLLTTVTACSGGPEDGGPADDRTAHQEFEKADSAAPPEFTAPRSSAGRDAGPDIRPGSAPGVAFSYRYAFRLGADRVAEAQQQHQRLCERYTVTRCRITGMNYRAASDEDVEAMLSLLVDPAIAGQLGRESVQAVIGAEGRLAESEITGTDVGAPLTASARILAELTQRLERIEARLRSAGDSEKGQLEAEAEALRQQVRNLQSERDGQQSMLAMTPMLLRYGSGDLAPGPAPAPSLGAALRQTGNDLEYSATLLLVVLIRLLPWALAGLLVWAVARAVRRQLPARAAALFPEPSPSA